MAKFKVGIIGATGYTGSELVRLLDRHSGVSISFITSESYKGKQFSDVHPQFSDLNDYSLVSIEDIDEEEVDLIFLALPHGVSMDFITDKWQKKAKIVDLSGDFRLKDAEMYEQWYGKAHRSPDLFADAAFGLPELFRTDIRRANLVANPGCYPTASVLPLAPLLKNGLIEPKSIVIDAKSGVTGAGAKAKPNTHFPDVFGNFSAYGIFKHRHTPEIQYALECYSQKDTEVIFTPHLLPIDRGILTTIYCKPTKPVDVDSLREYYFRIYEKEHFVRILDTPPQIKHVRGSNYCDIFVDYDERTNTIITIGAIDNLVKGAAGQAIQNMNIMLGLLEKTGLKQAPLMP